MNITEKSTEINYLAAMAVFQQLFDEQKMCKMLYALLLSIILFQQEVTIFYWKKSTMA